MIAQVAGGTLLVVITAVLVHGLDHITAIDRGFERAVSTWRRSISPWRVFVDDGAAICSRADRARPCAARCRDGDGGGPRARAGNNSFGGVSAGRDAAEWRSSSARTGRSWNRAIYRLCGSR